MRDPIGLRDELSRHAWAKFDQITGDSFPLYAHLEDTAEVARLLFSTWLSQSQRSLLAQAIGSEDLARKLSIWLAASHDTGKATIAFAIKARPCRERMQAAGYEFPLADPPAIDLKKYPHGIAGQIATRTYLQAKSAAWGNTPPTQAINTVAEIIGGHHGEYPDPLSINSPPTTLTIDEPECWHRVRVDLLQRADTLAEITEADWQQILSRTLTEPSQAILTGFLIICDWIASNAYYFPYNSARSASERAADALRRISFGEHWKPQLFTDTSQYFADRFNIPAPRPVQQRVAEIAASLDEPSLLLIEAPAGEGKTEMALAAAEILGAKFGLHGAMIALPTRATANAMFGRVLAWLRSGEANGSTVSVSLAHAKAQFDEQFQGLFGYDRGYSAYVYGEDARENSRDAVVANQWFRGNKRTGLADVVISTIDQLLFSTLKSKHIVLRHLGLSSKVVIIDEVHACDEFMGTYLFRALEWLGVYGVPVIALSATLPPTQRERLLRAYRKGAQWRQEVDGLATAGVDQLNEQIAAASNNELHPLVTAIGAENLSHDAPAHSGRRTDYVFETIEDDGLIDAVLREAETGGCVAVVQNTVRRAQQVYEALSTRFDGEVALFHSRFTVESRNRRERELVERLGPGDSHRPARMIVVATQVIESSLDVDFDLMFTDVAPMDLLIQRIGRVHRHTRPPENRPITMRQARIVLTGGSRLLEDGGSQARSDEPPEFDPGVKRVYGDALLLRTVAALRAQRLRHAQAEGPTAVVRVPEDVPALIRDTYREVCDPLPGWETRQQQAEEEREDTIWGQQNRSSEFVLPTAGAGRIAEWSRAAYSDASEETGIAQVRDADISIEMVLVQQRGTVCYSLPRTPEDTAVEQVDLIGGITEDLARFIATCTVSLPSWMTQGPALDRVLTELEGNGFEGWQRSIWLRGVLPLVLDDQLSAEVNGYPVRYDHEVGLIIEKKENS